MYSHPAFHYPGDSSPGDDIFINYLDGDGWQHAERSRALHILSQFYPSPDLLEVMLEEGAILPIEFGGFEARFCTRKALVAAGVLREQHPAATGLKVAA